MSMLICNGAQCQCTFGAAPSVLVVMPSSMVMGENLPAATIMDNKPMTNIMPFGMCSSLANPQVASATSAALGVLTPMPCIPATSAPWMPGSFTVMIGGNPALNDSSKLICSYGGMISITVPSAKTINIP